MVGFSTYLCSIERSKLCSNNIKMVFKVEAGIDITATTVVDLYRSPWQGPVTLVIHHEADKRRMSVASVERP